MNDKELGCDYIFSFKLNGWDWEVRLIPKELLTKELGFEARGFTFIDKFTIDIVAGLSKKETMLIFTHELSHAILSTQGRAFHQKFNQEDVCNFVAWSFPTILQLLDTFSQWWDAKEQSL